MPRWEPSRWDPGDGGAEQPAPDGPGRLAGHGGSDAAARTGRPARPDHAGGSGPATCRRWPATPQALGRLGGWPAQLGDALDQQQPTELGQASISMGHEGPLPARGIDNPSRPRGPSTVNNPTGTTARARSASTCRARGRAGAGRPGGDEGLQDVGTGLGMPGPLSPISTRTRSPSRAVRTLSRPVPSMPAERDAQRSTWAGWSWTGAAQSPLLCRLGGPQKLTGCLPEGYHRRGRSACSARPTSTRRTP